MLPQPPKGGLHLTLHRKQNASSVLGRGVCVRRLRSQPFFHVVQLLHLHIGPDGDISVVRLLL